jgi:hypothetical protein
MENKSIGNTRAGITIAGCLKVRTTERRARLKICTESA